MKLLFSLVLMSLLLLSCTVTPVVTPGGTATSAVTAETKDAMAFCGMGISSSSKVDVNAAVEKNGGKIGVELKDDLTAALSSKFSPSDAKDISAAYIACMEKRVNDRKVSSGNADIATCSASWACNTNAVAGVCICRTEIETSKKKYGWTDKKAAEEYFRLCNVTGMSACWPTGKMVLERSRCETVLLNAKLSLPALDSQSCKVTPSHPLS